MSYTRQTKNLAPVDDSVQLPAAIRAASARSSELHKAAYEQPTEQPTTPADTPNPAPNQEEEKGGEEGKPQEPKPQTPQAPEAGAANPPSQPQRGSDDFEHKYYSLKGRYDRQEEMLRSLTNEVAALRAAQRAPEPVRQPPSELQFRKITDEDKAAYGEDFIDVAQRAAEERMAPMLKSLQDEIRRLGGTVESVAETTYKATTQSMNQYLDNQLPNWREVNRSPKFLAWANLRDPFSNAIRIDMLREAHASGDAPRVLRFFQSFLADEAATAPAPAITPETPIAPVGKVPLETFAAPGRAKAPAATTPPGEKERITQAQIAKFYADVNRGVYRGNEAEKERLEKMIFEAQAEGRID